MLICIFQYTRAADGAGSIQIPTHERVMKINLFRDKEMLLKSTETFISLGNCLSRFLRSLRKENIHR